MMGRHIFSVLAALMLIISPAILSDRSGYRASPAGRFNRKSSVRREMIKGSNYGAAKGLMDEVLASNPNSGEAMFYKALGKIGLAGEKSRKPNNRSARCSWNRPATGSILRRWRRVGRLSR